MSTWIKVTPETMPQPGKTVLLYNGSGIMAGWLRDPRLNLSAKSSQWDSSTRTPQKDSITHWMPFPDPPSEGEL